MTFEDGSTTGDEPVVEPTDEEVLEALADQIDGELDLATVVAERDDYRETLLRVKAEFDNYRKRVARDEAELRERASEGLVEKLLVVLDACDAAVGHGATDVEPIAKMLLETLEREGLTRLAPEGDAFDPNQHEAVMHEEGDGGDAVVVETLRIGYQWKSRVLRPAMVKVRG